MKTLLTYSVRILGALALVLLVASPASAQENDTRDVNRIEVKDGKVYVNGEMVKELEDADLRVYFSKDGNNEIALFGRDGAEPFRNFHFAAPKMNKFLQNDHVVGWVGSDQDFGIEDFEFGENQFDFSLDMEPLHERIELLRDGNEPLLYSMSGDPEIMKMERESRELARKIRTADESAKAELNQELESLVNKIFDLKLEAQEARISKLSENMDKLREQLRQRRATRDQIIQRRLNQLRGERDILDW